MATPHEACVSALFGGDALPEPVLSLDGRVIAVQWRRGGIELVDARTATTRRSLELDDPASARLRAFTPDGRILVVTVDDDRTLAPFDVASGRPMPTLPLATVCTELRAGNSGVLCRSRGRGPLAWIPFDGAATGTIPAPPHADVIAVSPSGSILAIAVVPPDGTTEVVVRDLADENERRRRVPSLRRSRWPEPDERDPVGISTMMVSDAGDVVYATDETRVHLWPAVGDPIDFDPAEGPLAFEPGGAAIWGFSAGTLHCFGCDGGSEASSGGPEPMYMVAGEAALGFDGDDVVVRHAVGLDRYARATHAWTHVCGP